MAGGADSVSDCSVLNTSPPDLLRRERPMVPPANKLERVIWMLWLQGFENSREIVRVCLRSWKIRNPTWKVVELTEENLSEYIDADSLAVLKSLPIRRQMLADLIRMYLISTHGGVWADASCFCCQPLDSWLPAYMQSGFFAFRNPGPGRILSNWFLASNKGNLLASTFYERHRDFFSRNQFPLQQTEKGKKRVRKLGFVLNRNATLAQLWTYPLMTRTVGAHPYFIFHYHFARIVRENAGCREVWNNTPPFSADIPRKMNKAGILSPMTDELLEDLNQAKTPLYKLKWHYRQQGFRNGCILDHIMRSID